MSCINKVQRFFLSMERHTYEICITPFCHTFLRSTYFYLPIVICQLLDFLLTYYLSYKFSDENKNALGLCNAIIQFDLLYILAFYILWIIDLSYKYIPATQDLALISFYSGFLTLSIIIPIKLIFILNNLQEIDPKFLPLNELITDHPCLPTAIIYTFLNILIIYKTCMPVYILYWLSVLPAIIVLLISLPANACCKLQRAGEPYNAREFSYLYAYGYSRHMRYNHGEHDLGEVNPSPQEQLEEYLNAREVFISTTPDITLEYTQEVDLENELLSVEERKCSICLEKLTSSISITKLDCDHFFHTRCIQTWLQQTLNRKRCPICRNRISFSQEVDPHPELPNNNMLWKIHNFLERAFLRALTRLGMLSNNSLLIQGILDAAAWGTIFFMSGFSKSTKVCTTCNILISIMAFGKLGYYSMIASWRLHDIDDYSRLQKLATFMLPICNLINVFLLAMLQYILWTDPKVRGYIKYVTTVILGLQFLMDVLFKAVLFWNLAFIFVTLYDTLIMFPYILCQMINKCKAFTQFIPISTNTDPFYFEL